MNTQEQVATGQSSPEDLAQLLTMARQQDARCLNQLFVECRNFLHVLARAQLAAWLQAKVDASDLVQQTLMEAYRDFGRFEGQTEAEWLAWLRRILANNVANFVRHYRGTAKRQISREVTLAPAASDLPDALTQLPARDESPSRLLLRKERQVLVADALTQLAPDYQEVILLRNLQRLPFDEVARRMGRSRPAVQMLWMRAVQKLRQVLTALGGDESAPGASL